MGPSSRTRSIICSAAHFALRSCVKRWTPGHPPAEGFDELPETIREQFLAGCLDELSPAQWYRELNRRVFFWTSEERLVRLLGARAYRGRPHVVITIDSASLLRQHLSRVRLAPLNTGSTLYPNAPRRGLSTFRAMADQPESGKGSPVVEVTIEYSVPDIEACALRVERRLATDVLDLVWQRS
jgi:hypothetical protein